MNPQIGVASGGVLGWQEGERWWAPQGKKGQPPHGHGIIGAVTFIGRG